MGYFNGHVRKLFLLQLFRMTTLNPLDEDMLEINFVCHSVSLPEHANFDRTFILGEVCTNHQSSFFP